MGATVHGIFGDPSIAEPALPGTYGTPPSGYRLPAATRLGRVRLQIADLPRSLTFYERILGLRTLERTGSSAALAAQGENRVLVELHQLSTARPAAPLGRLGLYHFAILLPERAALGRFLRHLAESGVRAGTADHLVSEASYLTDPDGLGIEVYADRPRSTWRRHGAELMIATDPLDVAGLVHAAGDSRWSGMPAGTAMGHVHLHVGDLSQASAFYSEALGFDRITWRYPGALFLSAGGYHHHLGTNTWAGPGARPPAPDDARMLEWTIELPDGPSVAASAGSLSAGGHPVELSEGEVLSRDPWGTQIRLRVGAVNKHP